MTFVLQQKRVHANADQRDRQGGREEIRQMRDLDARGDPSSQRSVRRTLNRPAELAQIIPYPCKR